ncbi:WD40 repeat domain-containing protein, partial [uncultured Nostoc sp.]|uniref:WD40 repeat domain-containing protein n=1 Tax=uncultured Nostoc sp. TaxID=340711 RepID=UPI002631D1C3
MKKRQILTQAKEQPKQVLSETNQKANRRIRLGAIALRVMLTGAIAAGFAAWHPKTMIAVNGDRAVAAVETARPENKHLLKQSADSKQNLKVASQKQGVNQVSEQNSLDLSGINPLSGFDPLAIVNSVSFSPDGQTIVSGNADGIIKLWKPDGTLITTLSGHGHKIAVKSVTFSPDGEMIASGGGDNTIKLWKPDGTLIKTLTGHTDSINSVSFSPDGQKIASGSAEGTIKLWKPGGKMIKTLKGHYDGVEDARFP